MFSGIIETLGTVENILDKGSNKTFVLSSSFLNELKIDQSISHNGACLTVEKINQSTYEVTAIKETLEKTNFKFLKSGDQVNLERSMVLGGRIDGHLVQGHVDCILRCSEIKNNKGSWDFVFQIKKEFSKKIIEKGSIAINGVSLTCYNVLDTSFQVSVIPYTYNHTNFKNLKIGDFVNIEFDLIGKYIEKYIK